MKEIHDGDRVRVALGRSGMSHKDFAEAIGVSPSTLSRMLNEHSWRTDLLAEAERSTGVNLFQAYQSKENALQLVIGIIVGIESISDSDILKKLIEEQNGLT